MLLKAIFLPTTQRKQFYMPPKKTAGLCGDLPPTVAGSTPKLLLLPHMTAPTAGHLHRPSSYKTGGVRIGATFLSEEIQVPAEWTRRQGLSVWWSKRHRTRPGTSRCKHHLICKSFPTALLVWNTPIPFTPSSGFTMYLKKKKKIEVWLIWASLVAQLVKNPPAMQKTPVWLLGWEDPPEKG